MENVMKILFLTSNDVGDKYGNGGVQGTRKNFSLIEGIIGEENVILCSIKAKEHIKYERCDVVIEQPKNNICILFANLCGCKRYFPWQEKYIIKEIEKNKIDILFVDSSILGRIVRRKLSCKTIVFFHNIEAEYAWNKVKNEGIWFIFSFLASKINEKYAIKADKIGCLNEGESKKIGKLYGREADFYLPVTFKDRFDLEKVKYAFRKEILFVGSLFGPNEASINWFVENVMSELPEYTLNIVGKGFEANREKYKKYDNIRVIGSVKDIDEYYYKHLVVVMPILFGAGMKVKVAEAMMFGKNILATDEALAGYEVDGVGGIYRCNTSDEYKVSIENIFNVKEYEPYNLEVRNRFLEKYETGCLRKILEEIIRGI